MYTSILVPLDGTERSALALETALPLARLQGARVVALHSCAPLILDPDDTRPDDPIRGAWGRERVQLAHDTLAYARRRGAEEGVPVITELSRSDHPYEAIIAAARDQRCDLIVMASHGEGGLVARLLGSETQKVLTHCAIPVLVVR